jgi:hypothetical protein
MARLAVVLRMGPDARLENATLGGGPLTILGILEPWIETRVAERPGMRRRGLES